MILQFEEKKIEVKEEYVKTVTSKSTGNELNTYRFKIRVAGKEKFEEFKNKMNMYKEKFISQIDDNGNILAKYNVGTWSYRYYNEFDSEDTNYLCDVEIIQGEELKTDIIIIEGIENEVLKYKEEFDNYNKAIVIRAIIKNTEEQREKINNAIGDNKYFKVKRPGINNEILEMRFGKTIWSKHEGYIKRSIVLVEKKYDENDKLKKPFFWPELTNMMDIMAKNTVYIEKLEETLKKNNMITDENIKEIKIQVEKEYKNVYRQYYLVEDVEEDFE